MSDFKVFLKSKIVVFQLLLSRLMSTVLSVPS